MLISSFWLKKRFAAAVVAILCLLDQVVTSVSAEVCGEQSWHQRWNINFQVHYQVMDSSIDYNQVAIGATYPDISTYQWYAMLLFFSTSSDGIEDYLMINKWKITDTSEVNLEGVRAIAIDKTNSLRSIAVMQTDMDSRAVTILNYNRDEEFYGANLLQVELEAGL